jgi:hypothetical protein
MSPLPRWIPRLSDKGGAPGSGKLILAAATVFASADCSVTASQAGTTNRTTSLSQHQVSDSAITRGRETFVLTQAESVVVRCDTIRFRRAPSQAPANSSAAPRAGSSGSGHASHVSHASHASHASGGWV